MLQLVGIDVSVFNTHLFRSASVSKALKGKCSVKNILDTAGWKADSNFVKYYHRSVGHCHDMSFAKAVFQYN